MIAAFVGYYFALLEGTIAIVSSSSRITSGIQHVRSIGFTPLREFVLALSDQPIKTRSLRTTPVGTWQVV